jgi:hypothetical protein
VLGDGGGKQDRVAPGQRTERNAPGRLLPVRRARSVRMVRPAALSAGRCGEEKRRRERDREQ